MKIIHQSSDIEQISSDARNKQFRIGFVPTMGALHRGHASLVERSKRENDVTIVSIFVNPTQFNNKEDFEKYPIKTEADLSLLESLACDYVFLPTVEEVYPPDLKHPIVDLGNLDQILEGKFRPGHFKGVVEVVYRFFDLIKPTNAYFGLKDFQQVAVIKRMINQLMLPINIVACETLREKSGLAMSSRNLRLTEAQREEALFIYKSLKSCRELSNRFSPLELKQRIEKTFQESSLRLEYLEFISPDNFENLRDQWVKKAVACIVAYVGAVRLIDNLCVYECD